MKPARPWTFLVYGAADNSADFATVQGAIDSFAPGSTVRTINIAPGVYQEMLFLRSKNNITLKGSNNGLDTVIQYDNCDGFNPGTGGGQTVTTPGAAGTIPGYGAAAGNAASSDAASFNTASIASRKARGSFSASVASTARVTRSASADRLR